MNNEKGPKPMNERLESLKTNFNPETDVEKIFIVGLSVSVAGAILDEDLETLKYIADTVKSFEGRVTDQKTQGRVDSIGWIAQWGYEFGSRRHAPIHQSFGWNFPARKPTSRI